MKSEFNFENKVWSGIKCPWPFASDLHISEIVLDNLKKTPQRVVQISADDGTEMNCEDLRIQIVRVAQNLMEIGVKDEDVVGVVCSNSLDLMALTNGIIQLGAIVNPMSVEHSCEDLEHIFRQTVPMLVICDLNVHDKVQRALKQLGNDSPIYTALGNIEGAHPICNLFKATGIEDNYKPQKFSDSASKTMGILSSSGTSGPAKGVRISQTFVLKFHFLLPTPKQIRVLNFSPIFWGSAFGSLILAAITDMTRIVTAKPFTPERFFDLATKFKVVQLSTSPPMLTMLLESPLMQTFDKSHLRIFLSMGGIMSVPLREQFKKEFPESQLINLYGSTEVAVSMTFEGQPFDGLTVGTILPNHEVKIVADDGKLLGVGMTGEIYAKFCIHPFLGYYNNLQVTKDSVDSEGFVKMGDIGFVDERGFLHVIDRKKDIFNCKGHHINPSEIESVVQAIEGVKFVSVVGIPNPTTYNLIAAVVEKKNGFEALSELEIIKIAAQKLPVYKQLNGGVYFVDDIPMTVTSKIIKRLTKEIAIQGYQKANA